MVLDIPKVLRERTALIIRDESENNGVPSNDLCFDIATSEVELSVI